MIQLVVCRIENCIPAFHERLWKSTRKKLQCMLDKDGSFGKNYFQHSMSWTLKAFRITNWHMHLWIEMKNVIGMELSIITCLQIVTLHGPIQMGEGYDSEGTECSDLERDSLVKSLQKSLEAELESLRKSGSTEWFGGCMYTEHVWLPKMLNFKWRPSAHGNTSLINMSQND